MQCLRYFAQTDKNGWPIPSTMAGFTYDYASCHCNWVELPDSIMTVGVGEEQVYHPQRLRYFYRFDCRGKVLPNSLFISRNHPGGNVLEFKKIITTS